MRSLRNYAPSLHCILILPRWRPPHARYRSQRQYLHCMLFGSDCHSHVARVMDLMRIGGCACHNKVVLAATMFFCGRHTGIFGFVSTWLGFVLFVTILWFTRGS